MRLGVSLSSACVIAFVAFADAEWLRATAGPQVSEVTGPSACVSQSKLVEKVRHYDFFGSRAPEAGASLRQRLLVTADYSGQEKRFTGQTDWHIEWRACFEPQGALCRIGGVISTVNVSYTLPRWADRAAASSGLRGRWDRYMASLAAHEKGHGAIAHEVARMIEKELVGQTDQEGCAALNARSTHIVEEVMRRGEAMQRDYDRATAHGSTQGAQFPF